MRLSDMLLLLSAAVVGAVRSPAGVAGSRATRCAAQDGYARAVAPVRHGA